MRYALMLFAVMMLPLQVRAQSFVEAQMRFDQVIVDHCDKFNGITECSQSSKVTNLYPEIHLYMTKPIAKREGLYAWAVASGNSKGEWGEVIVGHSFMPKPFVQFDFGAGIETDRDPWRVMSSVFVGNSRVQVFTSLENGGSGPWYLVTANLNVFTSGDFSQGIGLIDKKLVGLGPRLQMSFGNGVMAWVSDFIIHCHEACIMGGLRVRP